jgi:uncharacterized protein
MTVELRPYGTRCTIQCNYCYQEPRRKAGQVARKFDMSRMKEAILAEGGPFSLFGGEPLLVPIEDLEELWSWGLAQFGQNTIQTNGTLINHKHIDLFRRYNVSVGVSVDGPGELNDLRWAGAPDATSKMTARTEAALALLCREGIRTSLIVTLHRGNALDDRLVKLLGWVRSLDDTGIVAMRLHLLESEFPEIRARYALSSEENILALRGFLALEKELKRLVFDVFQDIRRMLVGDDQGATCVWKSCDPYTTRAVRGVEGDGQRSNCGRTNKEGIEFVKSKVEGFERTLALYATPQSAGGCKGCRFFLMCRGHCPGTAIDGDWRNRSEHCEVWKALFSDIEQELVDRGIGPLSLSRHRKTLEWKLVEGWSNGRNLSLATEVAKLPRPRRGPGWRRELNAISHQLTVALNASRHPGTDEASQLSPA